MSGYRNRDLLDLAYAVNCSLRIPGVCTGGSGEPCHSNMGRHGKGMSIKADDMWFASGCRPCHMALDSGKNMTREEKQNLWQTGFERTYAELWKRGLLQVAA